MQAPQAVGAGRQAGATAMQQREWEGDGCRMGREGGWKEDQRVRGAVEGDDMMASRRGVWVNGVLIPDIAVVAVAEQETSSLATTGEAKRNGR